MYNIRPVNQEVVLMQALQKVTGRDPAHGNAAGSSAATGHLTDIAVRHAPSGAASLRLPHQPPTSIAASLAEMLESLPTPAECSPAASAQGSYAASLGSIMWVPGDASEQQVTSRAHSSFSSIDLLAHTRRSSLASDQITHQAVTDSYSAALLATASAAFSADPVPQLPDSAADQSCASHLNRKHAPFIAGAPQLSLGAAVPELTANSAAVQQAGFARVMNQQGAYSEACGDRGTSAGPVSMQEEISDLDGLLFSRQASLTNAPAARKFFLKRPFSSSPAGGYSTLMDVQTQHMLADAAVSSQQMLAAAATHPYTDSLSSVFAPATPARQMLMAEGSCDSLRSASDVSAAVPQATGVSESSFVSGQDDLQFLRAYGGFTDKDSSAVVGQPRKTFKLLKIGSLGRKQGHKWGKFKEEQVEAGERENLNTTDNKQKRKMFRKLSDLVNSKLPGIAGGISSANFSMGSKTGLVESAVADGSISGADLISAHHSGVEALPRSPVARASSKLGNLFKRG